MVISDLTEVFLAPLRDHLVRPDRPPAKHENTDLHATAHANCDCGGGDTDATAKLDYNSTARVVGRDTSIIRTAYLWLEAFQDPDNDHYTRSADSDGGLLDGGSESSPGSTNRFRSFHWESTVILLGEPNPVLVIDSTGTIADKTRNVQVRAYNPVTHTYSGLLGVGDQIPVNQWIVVGDLLYDETGYVHFEANDTSPDSKIIGNAGEFQIKDTWDRSRSPTRPTGASSSTTSTSSVPRTTPRSRSQSTTSPSRTRARSSGTRSRIHTAKGRRAGRPGQRHVRLRR